MPAVPRSADLFVELLWKLVSNVVGTVRTSRKKRLQSYGNSRVIYM